MEIKLKNIILENFKGIKSFDLQIDSDVTNIMGDNATGKTTLYDSFLWLFFDKDSTNRSNFTIKPQNKDGNDVHFLETKVEAELEIDGNTKTLTKMFKEKWTRKRGEQDKIFDGHSTEYWIDGVPKKKKEYQEFIASLLDENTFKLITNPLFFNTQLDWKKRREVLFEISGDIPDVDIVAGNEKYKNLTAILNGNTVDDAKKVIQAQLKKLNEDIEKIPTRIDELYRGLPELDESTLKDTESRRKQIVEVELPEVESQISNIGKITAIIADKYKKLEKLKSQLNDRKDELNRENNKEQVEIQSQIFEKERKLQSLNNAVEQDTATLATLNIDIGNIKDEMQVLRNKWGGEKATQYTEPDDGNFICPTCKQGLPLEDIEQQKAKLKKSFEENKAKTLEEITNKGKRFAAELKNKQAQVEKLNNSIKENKESVSKLETDLLVLRGKNTGAVVQADYAADSEYKKINIKINTVNAEISNLDDVDNTELTAKKTTLMNEVTELDSVLVRRTQVEETNARIEELKAQEKDLAQKIADAESEKFLIEEFITDKCNLLEGKINGLFKTVKWKLFNRQINGGIVDCCECLINGVPFLDANNAAKINSGVEIINVLSEYYGVLAPIFIDNAEAVTKFTETKAQVIKLIVAKGIKELTKRVED